jgi:hypothetical protein
MNNNDLDHIFKKRRIKFDINHVRRKANRYSLIWTFEILLLGLLISFYYFPFSFNEIITEINIYLDLINDYIR